MVFGVCVCVLVRGGREGTPQKGKAEGAQKGAEPRGGKPPGWGAAGAQNRRAMKLPEPETREEGGVGGGGGGEEGEGGGRGRTPPQAASPPSYRHAQAPRHRRRHAAVPGGASPVALVGAQGPRGRRRRKASQR